MDDVQGRDADSPAVTGRVVRTIRSPKVRALLAALLLEGGRVVSVESLTDVLWGGAPPASARASLHNHVARLRRLLDDPERLRAVPPGYVLRVDEGELDVDVFVSRVAAARAAHAARDWERTVRECTAALALWRGTPLAGLPADVGGYALGQRLREARLLLLEWRYDAELALAGPRLDGLVPELAALAAEHPLRESFHRHLMLALHRTGRRAEALAVHRDLRTRLIEELGVEPGAGVREAHIEVLRGTGDAGGAGEPGAVGGAGRGVRGVGAASGDYEVSGTEEAAGGSAGREGDVLRRVAEATTAHADNVLHGAAPLEATRDDDAVRHPTSADGFHGTAAPARRETEASAAQPIPETDVPASSARHETDAPVAQSLRHANPPAVPTLRTTDTSTAPIPRDSDAPAAPASPQPEDTPPTPASPHQPEETPPTPPQQQGPPPPPRPAQLPPPPAYFTGRTAVLDDLRRTLAPAPAPQPTVAVAVISGMAGVGKSALALQAAHGLANRFPDGQLYVNLHGATPGMPPLTPGQALAALLRDLGADPRSIPEHPDAATALLRSLLAPTRTLMVLDDAASAAQVRPLLPAGPGCAVIVTSRSPLTALDGVRRIPLTPLTAEDSAALLRAASGRDAQDVQGTRPRHDAQNWHDPQDHHAPQHRHHAPQHRHHEGDQRTGPAAHHAHDGLDAAHPLIELTGRLPLALRVVAARLAARRALTLDVLADQLAAAESRLHHLEYDDLSVRRSLAVAHDALAASDHEADRDAALALRRIGAVDLPTYGAHLLARLTGTDERRAEAALDRLVDVALLEEIAYGRYAPHDLVRDFARELAGAEADGETDTAEAALRWYAAVAERTLTAIVEPGLDQDDRCRPTAAQPPEHTADVRTAAPFGSPEEAFAWGDLELGNVVVLVERYANAVGDGTAAHISTLSRLLFPCVQRAGRVAEMEVLGRAALRVARRLGDEAAEAYALGDLAGLHFLTGRNNEALTLNDRSLAIWRRLDVASRIWRCLNNRGLLLENLGRYAESGQALRQSLEYSRQLDDPYGEAVTYQHLGNLYEHTDPRAAIEQHRRSLAIGDRIGNVVVRHSAHCNIGYAHVTLGEPAAAVPHFDESLRILGGHSDWHGESQTRLGLVRALRLLGRGERAERECAELLHRADARADRYTAGLARHLHGLLLRERGRIQEAYDAWRTALEALDGTDEKTVLTELRELLADDGLAETKSADPGHH
ncbi:BTAD domain-containing putative transcriptional regulator [Streptomyces sp. NPDC093591]|uniref:AfsR/SARP family transcriptional regulator n=1 Tax=Streptomyces sp. NPDC093591 TaxID=3366044 RepID=UPI00382AC972